MFKKLILTSFLLFSSLITIYPSKKENTNFFDYCYSLEKKSKKDLILLFFKNEFFMISV